MIETGRYKGIERKDRLCTLCKVVEDEEHAVYVCGAYRGLRMGRELLLESNPSIKELLNPKDKETAYRVGCLLKEIEERRKELFK